MEKRLAREMLQKGDLVSYNDAIPDCFDVINDIGVVVEVSGVDTVKVQWQKSGSTHRYLREELRMLARNRKS
jgi:hypothetical protein|tara:strand:- start:416 stop:631 length:216 start_codon:yes stop_codon:yes gene_type:complete